MNCIEENAFSGTIINNIKLPPRIQILEEARCSFTPYLNNVFIPPNNPIKVIEEGIVISLNDEHPQKSIFSN